MTSERIQRIVGELLDKAELALTDQRWNDLQNHAAAALSLDPRSADARSLRDLAQEHLDEPNSDSGRRQLTILFADLVGSTPMSGRLDPETYARLIRSYQRACRRGIERYGGWAHDEQGDGFLAVFGYPIAHGEDATRALVAGLQIIEDVATASDRYAAEHGEQLVARIGIHTGLAVVAHDGNLYGEAINIAARVQAHAEDGTVLASGTTAALANDNVQLEKIDTAELRGVADPVELFAVRGTSPRLEVLASHRIGPIVGRDAEVALLRDMWNRAAGGAAGTVVQISGEAGIGKSRLTEEARRLVTSQGNAVFVMASSGLNREVALYPVISGLAQQIGLQPSIETTEQVDRLKDFLFGLDMLEPVNLSVLASMLGVVHPDVGPPELEPPQLREARLRLLANILEAVGAQTPTLLILEDLHWADDTTVDLLNRLIASGLPSGTMMMVTARPEAPALGGVDHHIILEGLTADQCVAVLRQHDVPDEALDKLVSRSDGVPLYLEQMALSQSIGDAVPPTLTELFQSRLDSAGPAKALAQFGSAFGRKFPLATAEIALQLLATTRPDDSLLSRSGSLDVFADDLVRAGIVDFDANGIVHFRHALLRDAAYESQLLTERPSRHEAIARALEHESHGFDVLQPARVAFHFEAAGLPHEAVPRWLAAGAQQARSGESALAMKQYQQAQSLIDEIEHPSKPALELGVYMSIATLTAAQAGYAAPGVADLYERSLELCDQLSEVTDISSDLVRTLLGLWTYHCMGGRMQEATEVTNRLEVQVAQSGFAGGEASVLANRGVEAFVRGDLPTSRENLRAAVAAYHDDDFDPATWPLPNDGLTAVLAVLAQVEELMGDRETADRLREQAIERADSLPYPLGPFSISFARGYEAWSGYMAGDHERCTAAALETIAVAERHGFAEWQLMGAVHLTAANGLVDEHVAVVEGLTPLVQMLEGLGAHSPLGSFWATIALAHIGLEQWSEAEQAIQQGDRFVTQVGHELATPTLRLAEAKLASAQNDMRRAQGAVRVGLASARLNQNVVAERPLIELGTELGIEPVGVQA